MIVGVSRLVLSIPENRSLKGKRRVVKSTLDRVRNRFNAAAAEVDELDNVRTAVLGVVVVSNETGHANAMMEEVASFVGLSGAGGVLVDRSTELIPMGSFHEGLL